MIPTQTKARTEVNPRIGSSQLLLWSAPDAAREARIRAALGRYLGGGTTEALGSAACHLANRPADGAIRGAVVATTSTQAITLLNGFNPDPVSDPRPVALIFPGQGAQYPRMAAGLYGREPVFTKAMDDVFTLLGARGEQLRSDWLADDPSGAMDDGTRAQPLLFAVGYALGTMVCGWGVRPAALLGHSVGELVAATLAGVFDLRAVVRLMDARVDALTGMPAGGMLAVAASVDEVRPLLSQGEDAQVVIAAVNAPRQTLLAGPDRELTDIEGKLKAHGLVCRRAKARQGFHSPMMQPIAQATESAVAAARPRIPSQKLYSAYTGGLLTGDKAQDITFWSSQLSAPVLFWPALNSLLDTGDYLLVEAGPGQSLSQVARQHPAVRGRTSDAVSLLPARPGEPEAEGDAVLAAAAKLWLDGHQLRREAFLDGAAVASPR